MATGKELISAFVGFDGFRDVREVSRLLKARQKTYPKVIQCDRQVVMAIRSQLNSLLQESDNFFDIDLFFCILAIF